MFINLRIGFLILRSIVTGKTMVTEIEQWVQAYQRMNLYLWIPIILIAILSIVGRLFYKKIILVLKWVSSRGGTLKRIFPSSGEAKGTNSDELFKTIESAGYLYDEQQDIFYSNMDSWQKNMGYCSLYDEAAILSGMIIDCEPIKFIYGGKEWLIEFWKGQYGMSTGCEIGAYIRDETKINISGMFKEYFYKAVSKEERLQMSFSLKKMGETLFTRNDKHWWLTGFMLGEFSEPSELIMNLSISLNDLIMRDAFVEALKNVGYLNDEIFVNGNTVFLKFDKPRTQQPNTRIEKLDWITQRKNKILCDKYQEVTKNYDNFADKINAIKKEDPDLYNRIINIGKPKDVFNQYEKIKNSLKQ